MDFESRSVDQILDDKLMELKHVKDNKKTKIKFQF